MMNKYIKKPMQLLPDKAYIRIKYWYHFKEFPNLKHPKTFNEKLQWLKLYDRKPIYALMVDKYEAKKFISDRIGDQYVIPTYGVWDNFDEIDFDSLPEQFVLKTTHDCGGVVLCRDKHSFDKEKARDFLNAHMSFNYFYECREWPYKNVKPRIFAEQLLVNENGGSINDYKFFTFNGIPRLMYIAQGNRETHTVTADFFDMDGKHLDLTMDHDNSPVPPALPENFTRMRDLSAKLAKNTPQLRVDFYEINGKVYSGEMTFFHVGGLAPIFPEKWNTIMGDWITLPELSGDISR